MKTLSLIWLHPLRIRRFIMREKCENRSQYLDYCDRHPILRLFSIGKINQQKWFPEFYDGTVKWGMGKNNT
jgi:hypothetical protein